MPFFQIAHERIIALVPVVKKRLVSKKALFLCPYFIKKRHLHDKGALMPFFQNLNDNSPAVMPIFGQKSSILSKLQYIMVTTL